MCNTAMGSKTKIELKKIELNYCHHSICLKKNEHLKKRMSELDEKLPIHAHLIFKYQSGIWPIW